MIPVVELLRVSTESQAAENRSGLDSQRTLNRRTCETYGLELIESVQIVESGADVATTPGMARVLDEITSGRARGILLAEYSRLFRPDRWSDLIVLQTISDHDARIYLPSGPIDLQSEIGFVQATVNNLLAAMERRRIRERMDRGKEEHRRRGNHVAGGVGLPFGITWSKAEGWAYTTDIAIVRELFRRFLEGERNLAELARVVGLPRTNVRYLLTNPVYSGWRIYDRRTLRRPGANGTWRKIPRRPEDVLRVKLPLEPIVDVDEFVLVQEILSERTRPRRSNHDIFLYRGILRCECGVNVYTTSSGNGRHFYYCRSWNPNRASAGMERCGNGYMTVRRIEELLDDAITRKLTNLDVLVAAVGAYHDALQKPRGDAIDRPALQERVGHLEQKRARILDAFCDGHMPKAERDRRLLQVDEEIGTTERLLEHVSPKRSGGLTEELISGLAGVFAEWKHVDRSGRREILESVAPTFTVRKYGVEGVRFPVGLLSSGMNSDSHWRMGPSPSPEPVTASPIPPA